MSRREKRICDRCWEERGDVHAMIPNDTSSRPIVFLCGPCRSELPVSRYQDLSVKAEGER